LVWFPILMPKLVTTAVTNTAAAICLVDGSVFELGSYLMVVEALIVDTRLMEARRVPWTEDPRLVFLRSSKAVERHSCGEANPCGMMSDMWQ